MTDTVQPDYAKPKTMLFRKRSDQPRLSPECAKRQGDITRLAFNLLGGGEPTLRFLNQPHEALKGRPLDVAIASAGGYAKVEQAIRSTALENKA